MNPLLFVAGAAGVSGIILATEKVQSRQLANEWAVGVPNFFCKVLTLQPPIRTNGNDFSKDGKRS